MTGKATTVFLAAMFASQVALPAVSFAGGKKGTSSTTVSSTATSFKAKLAPPSTTPVAADLIGECEGEAKYKKKVTTKTPLPPAATTTTTEESFSAEVECPISDVLLASTDVYDMHLARGGAEYAVCSLVIKEIEFEYSSGSPLVPAGMEGEYAVKVSQKMVSPATTPTVTVKIGGCVVQTGVDPLGAPVFGSGVPAVLNLDTATVFLNGGLTPVLTGTFGVGSFDDDD